MVETRRFIPPASCAQHHARTRTPAYCHGSRVEGTREGSRGEKARAERAPAGAERGAGVPASDGVGGSGGAKPPGKKLSGAGERGEGGVARLHVDVSACLLARLRAGAAGHHHGLGRLAAARGRVADLRLLARQTREIRGCNRLCAFLEPGARPQNELFFTFRGRQRQGLGGVVEPDDLPSGRERFRRGRRGCGGLPIGARLRRRTSPGDCRQQNRNAPGQSRRYAWVPLLQLFLVLRAPGHRTHRHLHRTNRRAAAPVPR